MHINGINLHVQLLGKGFPLVVLHGLTSNMTALQREINHLSQYYQTIAIDSRGHGYSDKPAIYTLQDHVDDVIGVLDAYNIKTTFLLGISMGSYIAQGVAIQQPHRVVKLILITPKAHGETSSAARFLAEHAKEVNEKTPEEIQEFLLSNIFSPTTKLETKLAYLDFIQQQTLTGLALTPEQTLAANLALENFDFRSDLSKIEAETLVISGKYDPLNPPKNGQEIANSIPNSKFVLLENSGHVPTYEEPQQLIALIENFLEK